MGPLFIPRLLSRRIVIRQYLSHSYERLSLQDLNATAMLRLVLKPTTVNVGSITVLHFLLSQRRTHLNNLTPSTRYRPHLVTNRLHRR